MGVHKSLFPVIPKDDTPADPYHPSGSFSQRFHDLRQLATAIPGGDHGVIQAAPGSFKGIVRVANLPSGVSTREFGVSNPVIFRSDFIGGRIPWAMKGAALQTPTLFQKLRREIEFEVRISSICTEGLFTIPAGIAVEQC